PYRSARAMMPRTCARLLTRVWRRRDWLRVTFLSCHSRKPSSSSTGLVTTCERSNTFSIIKCNIRLAAMGKCVLSIELEDPTATYRAGQKVRGQVQVDADADVRCRSLLVYAGWQTRGMGNVASQHGPKQTLFSGELVAGASKRFAFEVDTLLRPRSEE